MMTCAPFTKSPNCASQSVRQLGSVVEKPYSKPSTASSDSSESMTVKRGWLGRQVLQRDVGSPLFWSVPHGVAMEERAAAAVLAGEADLEAFGQQASRTRAFSAKPQSSGSCPAAIFSRSCTMRATCRCSVKFARQRRELRRELAQLLDAHAGRHGLVPVGVRGTCVQSTVCLLPIRPSECLACDLPSSSSRRYCSTIASASAIVEHAFGDQALGIDLPRRRLAAGSSDT